MKRRYHDNDWLGTLAKVAGLNPLFVIALLTLMAVGVAALYSAGGGWQPWAAAHALRLLVGVGLMLLIAMVHIRFWLGSAYLIYAACLGLLLLVEIAGFVGMGAQRWVSVAGVALQPSELMKVALILALARYVNNRPLDSLRRLTGLLIPALIILVPAVLVLLQPNLGTALLLTALGAGLVFASGARVWIFVVAGVVLLAAVPVVWHELHDYQRQRVLTFLDPSRDPKGAGYHITQAKIALGSGGVFGKGFMQGTQAHLDFLPEKHTDFIFTLWAEEFGLLGAAVVLLAYGTIMLYGLSVALKARSTFASLVALGVALNLFLYVLANVAMISGLIPVVGIPIPLLSYGGSVMLAVFIGLGLYLSAALHRDAALRGEQ